jgi:hypothetical protein
MTSSTSPAALAAFLTRWQAAGGSERANYQLFVTELCALLGVPLPEPARDDTRDNAYVFERRIVFAHGDGSSSNGYIDCYKRGHFVLEAKKIADGAAKLGRKTFDDALLRARSQAEAYARALPAAEGRPPLLLVIDVGHLIELYAEFSRSGATYTPFPDARSHRITLAALCEAGDTGEQLRQRLRAAWLDPLSLDPSRASAKVTRQVSLLLAELARSLEAAGHAPQSVAAFLSRCLFCMFAEDVELLPKDAEGRGAFIGLLTQWVDQPAVLARMLRALWMTMDAGGFAPALAQDLLRFNGKLFKGSAADDYVLPLDRDQIALLQRAARANWREVEPAIFGTLLERALSPSERHALGAHYTPRAYVERLVLPTVMEPLRADWADAQAAALLLAREAEELDGRKHADKLDEARAELKRFHHQLCHTRVLDPACGSGNFLYVTLEHLKRLEAEVLARLAELGATQAVLGLEGETVTLQQFLGIELNPRAAALAELVLWIGWLQWQIRSFGNQSVAEPVVHDYRNIACRDAVLAWDRQELACDEAGKPLTRWDGVTRKPHPVTGELVPDEAAQVPQWRYINPRQAEWPQADFIVGNPPFIGKLKMREALGDGYAEALRGAWSYVPESADFVMYWWQKAALAVRMGETRRMGLITTNSLTMIFNRRVIEAALSGPLPAAALPAPSGAEPRHAGALMPRHTPKSGAGTPRPGLGDAHLAFAIPDHPWVDVADGAAVRIAMSVTAQGDEQGRLLTVQDESAGDSGEANVRFTTTTGVIHANLRVGAQVTKARRLTSNGVISAMGMILVGAGFIVEAGDPLLQAEPERIHPYLNGKDLTQRPRGVHVIDMYGLTIEEVRRRYPACFQRLHDRVKPERDVSKDKTLREQWWLFRRTNIQLRQAIAGLPRYIGTTETAKHRLFSFIAGSVTPDQKVRVVGSDDALHLGVLSSNIHVDWALATGGRLGVGNDPVYNNTSCFETFPFPADDTGLTPALAERIRSLAEQLDAHRKARQAAHESVTLTGMYNVLDKLRRGEVLTAKDKALHEHALVGVLASLHDELDAAVLQAYGWSDLGPVPWAGPNAGEARAAWTESLLERLVALNTRRAAEEATGTIRWLRPEFQDPARRAAAAAAAPAAEQVQLPMIPGPETAADEPSPDTLPAATAPARTPWPSDLKAQLRSVAELLAASPVAFTLDQIADRYTGRGPWKKRLPDLLATLEALARARCEAGRWRGA